MEQIYSQRKPIRATLKGMEINDIVHYPVSRLSVIRATASTLGLELERNYVTRLNREAMTIDVIRTA